MRRWLLWAALLLAAPAWADDPLAADLREEVRQLPVKVSDIFGRSETRELTLTLFWPAGEGPFPLLLFNHGRAVSEQRATQGRQRYEAQARYFASKGFLVAVPTRVGYHQSYGDFDPEAAGQCDAQRPEAVARVVADELLAVVEHLRTIPRVGTQRWVAAGVSAGGAASVALAARNPPGLVATINFSGGAGGNPITRPGNPCSPKALTRSWRELGASAKAPMLWLYWQNDRFWGADWPREWHHAFVDGGGQAEFEPMPAVGEDGHRGLSADMDHWVPRVEAFLGRFGFTRSGVVQRPPASDFAKVDESEKVPVSAASRNDFYRRFLASNKPRAFAIGTGGAVGYATGDWAMGRALGFCQARRGQPCRLYAVDDDVVWVP